MTYQGTVVINTKLSYRYRIQRELTFSEIAFLLYWKLLYFWGQNQLINSWNNCVTLQFANVTLGCGKMGFICLYLQDLVRHMMQKEPSHRLSAEEYLIQQRVKTFPDYFYTFLKLYIQRFATPPILSSDERIFRYLMFLLHWIQDQYSDKCSRLYHTASIIWTLNFFLIKCSRYYL